MITAITPTGDRPLAFSLCLQWIANQTIKPDQWIIVDDGRTRIDAETIDLFDRLVPDVAEIVRREPNAMDPKMTLALNLLSAIPFIQNDKILIIEDDEYYAPGYIAEIAAGLDRASVVGIGMSRYYHLPSSGNMTIGTRTHASLAETGFRRAFLPIFERILKTGVSYIDFEIWRHAMQNKTGLILFDLKKPLYVGIKGLPGRNGFGRGHDAQIYKTKDPTRAILKKWIPNDYQIYLDLLGKLNV